MESLHYLLMKSHAMLSRRILAQAGKLGLTSGQPKVLDFLWKYQEADQKTIAAYCEIEPATVGSILLRMENSGLIVRRQKDGNRRSLYVSHKHNNQPSLYLSLTPAGRETAAKLMDIFDSEESSAAAGLTPEEQTTLNQLLGKLCDTMQTPNQGKKATK